MRVTDPVELPVKIDNRCWERCIPNHVSIHIYPSVVLLVVTFAALHYGVYSVPNNFKDQQLTCLNPYLPLNFPCAKEQTRHIIYSCVSTSPIKNTVWMV